MLAAMVDKEHFWDFRLVKMVKFVVAWVLITISKLQPSYFSIPLGTENLNMSAPARLQTNKIATCCTCLTVTLILVLERPTNTF